MFDFPDALKAKLLEFLPTDDTFVKPPKPVKQRDDGEGDLDEAEPKMLPDERRRLVWSFIKMLPSGRTARWWRW